GTGAGNRSILTENRPALERDQATGRVLLERAAPGILRAIRRLDHEEARTGQRHVERSTGLLDRAGREVDARAGHDRSQLDRAELGAGLADSVEQDARKRLLVELVGPVARSIRLGHVCR